MNRENLKKLQKILIEFFVILNYSKITFENINKKIRHNKTLEALIKLMDDSTYKILFDLLEEYIKYNKDLPNNNLLNYYFLEFHKNKKIQIKFWYREKTLLKYILMRVNQDLKNTV
jgi:hypothetical protein